MSARMASYMRGACRQSKNEGAGIMATITVIVGDGDPGSLRNMVNELKAIKEVDVVCATTDGAELIEAIQELNTNFVLTGILLKHIDGFGVLDAIRRMNGEHPKTIIYSSLNLDRWVRLAFFLGASFYMLKPTDPGQVYRRMRMMLDDRWLDGDIEFEKAVRSVAPETRLRAASMNLFTDMGIAANNKGYHYLVESTLKVMLSETPNLNLCKEVYPEIAKKYLTSAICVERAMRTAIQNAWDRGGITGYASEHNKWLMLKSKPTVGSLITFASRELMVADIERVSNSVDHW